MKDKNFIERSLLGALSFLKDSVFAEEYALRKGFLQVLEPRLKVISFAMFFITAILIKRADLLILLYIICLALAVLSKINLGYFLKRTWVFIPLFSLFIALPALFSVFTPGEAIATLKLLSFQLIITKEGLQGALLFILRVIVGVSYVVILSLTTRHTVLLHVLRIFGIPQVFVMVLGMCYRYIYLFVEIIENTYLAVKSRTGGVVHYKKGQRIIAWNIASLWQRSYGLSQQVYSAMLSRGYTGEVKLLSNFKIVFRDYAWFSFSALLCIFILLMNRWMGN